MAGRRLGGGSQLWLFLSMQAAAVVAAPAVVAPFAFPTEAPPHEAVTLLGNPAFDDFAYPGVAVRDPAPAAIASGALYTTTAFEPAPVRYYAPPPKDFDLLAALSALDAGGPTLPTADYAKGLF